MGTGQKKNVFYWLMMARVGMKVKVQRKNTGDEHET
jgi:hypothetical protein